MSSIRFSIESGLPSSRTFNHCAGAVGHTNTPPARPTVIHKMDRKEEAQFLNWHDDAPAGASNPWAGIIGRQILIPPTI